MTKLIVIQAITNHFHETGVKSFSIQRKYRAIKQSSYIKGIKFHRYYLINRYFICNFRIIKMKIIINTNIACWLISDQSQKK